MKEELSVSLTLDTEKYNSKIGEALDTYDTFVREFNKNPAKFKFDTSQLDEVNSVFKDIRKSAFTSLNAISKQLNKMGVQKMSIELDKSQLDKKINEAAAQLDTLMEKQKEYQQIAEKMSMATIPEAGQYAEQNKQFLTDNGVNPKSVNGGAGGYFYALAEKAADVAAQKAQQLQALIDNANSSLDTMEKLQANNEIKLTKLAKAAEPLKAEFKEIIGDLEAHPLDEYFDSSVLQQYNGQIDNLNSGLKRGGEDFDDFGTKAKKAGLSLLNLNVGHRILSQIRNRIAMCLNPLEWFRKAWNAIIMTDGSHFANTFEMIGINILNFIAPAIKTVAQWLVNLLGYLNVFLKAFSRGKIDLFNKTAFSAKKTADAMASAKKSTAGAAKAAKEMHKALAGFDEINNIGGDDSGDSGSGGGGGGAGGLDVGDLGTIEPDLNPNIVKFLETIGKKLRDITDWLGKKLKPVLDFIKAHPLLSLIIGGVLAAGIFLIFKKLKEFTGIGDKTTSLTEGLGKGFEKMGGGFGTMLESLGKAAIAIAILGGIALVLSQVNELLKTFAESGLSFGEAAGIIAVAIGTISVAFIGMFAVMSKLSPSLTSLAGAIVIFAGLTAVLLAMNKVIQTVANSGMSLKELGLAMVAVFTPILALVIAITAAAMILGSNPLALLAVLAVTAAIVAILLVLKVTLPTILDAVAGFFERTGPLIIAILDRVLAIINRICDSIDNLVNNLLAPILIPLFKSITTFLKDMIKDIKTLLTKIGEFFKGVKEKIVGVFVKGGAIFKGLTDGLLNICKTIINAIISGANIVIGAPFRAINGLLNTIRNVSFLKISPFKSLWGPNPLPVPQIPKLAVGTEFVPNDMLAYIHQGEAVIPKKFNDKSYFSGTGDMEDTNKLLVQVLDAIDRIEINPYTTIKDAGEASLQYIRDKSRALGRSVV